MSPKSDLGFCTFVNLEVHKLEVESLGIMKWSLGYYVVLSKLEWVLKCSKVEIERMA